MCSKASFLLLVILLLTNCFDIEGQKCRPRGKIRGKKPPPRQCNSKNDSDCCVQGKIATPRPISPSTASKMEEMVVALSTGWFNDKISRCLNDITTSTNGRSMMAMVVDECDSTMGCDADHDYQPPPRPNNIVDASKAVWEALGVSREDWGGVDITWSDA